MGPRCGYIYGGTSVANTPFNHYTLYGVHIFGCVLMHLFSMHILKLQVVLWCGCCIELKKMSRRVCTLTVKPMCVSGFDAFLNVRLFHKNFVL